MVDFPRVLIIEDQVELRQDLAEALEESGTYTFQTGSITGAKSILSRDLIDVILLDLELEDGFGLDILKYVRKLLRTFSK